VSSRNRRAAALLVAALLLLPASAYAGPWTLGAGEIGIKESLGLWRTDRKFASSLDQQLVFGDRAPVQRGEAIPFDPSTGGVLTTASAHTGIRLGLLSWLEAQAHMQALWMDFDTSPVDTVDASIGPGDLSLGLQARLPTPGRVALAARLETKLPTGDFDPSAYSVPLTEGQADVAATVSGGLSLWPYGYAVAEVGYRWRLENPENRLRPGDELRALVEAGAHLPWSLGSKLYLDALLGLPGAAQRFDVVTPLPRRRLLAVGGAIWWHATEALTLDVNLRWLAAGEDYPTGVQLLGGVAWVFDPFDR